jgi:type III secretion system PrgH/EprH family protein
MTSIENIHRNIDNNAGALFVLRILNGAMRGAEFELSRGNTLFVAGSADAFSDESRLPEFPDNAIFIPLDQGMFNFEIVALAEDNVTLRELNEIEVREQACPLNTVIAIGTLEFSVKPYGADWDAAVLNHPLPTLPAIKETPQPRVSMWRRAIIAGLLLTMLAVSIGTAYWMHDTTQRQKTRLSDLLQGSINEYQVVKGKDDVFYIFAGTLRDASWARQALVRSDFNVPVKVVYAQAEKTRIEKLLDKEESLRAYHILRLDDPANPELLVSAERGPRDQAARNRMAARVMTMLPYARQVQIVPLSDAVVARDAQRGLDRLGIRYKRTDKAGSTSFAVQTILDDSDLQNLRSYVDGFYQRWGSHYVHFSVDLKDDWLKGKSFGYGTDSYVKLTNSHWFFSNTIN